MLELVALQIEEFLRNPPSTHDRISIPLNQLETKIVNFQLQEYAKHRDKHKRLGSCKDRKSIDGLDNVMNNNNFYGIMNVKKRNANDSKTLK